MLRPVQPAPRGEDDAFVTKICTESCPAVADAGEDIQICTGDSVILDGSSSAAPTTCTSGLEYRWLEGISVLRDWDTDPLFSFTPTADAVVTLEVRCVSRPSLTDSDELTITVGEAPIADAGDDAIACEGETHSLDGSGSAPVDCPGGLEYRWLEGTVEKCGWSTTSNCDVTPAVDGIYTLEVRCIDSRGCVSSDDVLIEVKPGVIPSDIGNALRAVKLLPNMIVAWRAVPEAATYTLHRGTVKGVWPAPPFRPGITGTTETLSDVDPPPALFFYRVAGVNCAGVEGP